MFFGIGVTSSSIHVAGRPGSCAIASPKVLVVLVCTKAATPARAASSSNTSVPVTLVSTKSWRLWVTMCGLCSVAVSSTARAPRHRFTHEAAVADRADGAGERGGLAVDPARPLPRPRNRRISASPRWPALPVTRTVMAPDTQASVGAKPSGTARSAAVGRRPRHRVLVPAARVDPPDRVARAADVELGLDEAGALGVHADAELRRVGQLVRNRESAIVGFWSIATTEFS